MSTINGEITSVPSRNYINAIDGISQEGLFYGYANDDFLTPQSNFTHFTFYLDVFKNHGKTILITDYCSSVLNVTNSYISNDQLDFVSFSANLRYLTSIPTLPNPIFNENSTVVSALSDVKKLHVVA